jgi:hypothetical protein
LLIGNGEIANKDSGKGTVMIDSVYLPIRCEFGPSECYSKQFRVLGWGVGIHGAVREAVPHSILFAIGRARLRPRERWDKEIIVIIRREENHS